MYGQEHGHPCIYKVLPYFVIVIEIVYMLYILQISDSPHIETETVMGRTLNHGHPYIQSTPVLCDTNKMYISYMHVQGAQ